MDRQTVELSALGFEAVVTFLMALVYVRLWYRQRRPYFASWATAWALYGTRLGFISEFIVSRNEIWLFAHQATTGLTAMFLLAAALQFSRGHGWRWRYLWFAALPIVWAYIAIFVIHSMIVSGTAAVLLLSSVTIWTGWVFWQHRREGARWAGAIAITFVLWGLHHLDYPLLRPLGEGVLYGVFADVTFIVAVSMMTMFMVLREGRRALEERTVQLEQLTHLLMRAQEEERRRIARELHDEAGQILTAVKIELDLEGRTEASRMVGRALAQVRDLSNLIRPSVLDDLGLVPALRALAEDFEKRTQIRVGLEADEGAAGLPPDLHVVIYRVAQEALTNVARHAAAQRASVTLRLRRDEVVLCVEDDGIGIQGPARPNLGILGMRERVAAAGGTLHLEGAPGKGLRLEAILPAKPHAAGWPASAPARESGVERKRALKPSAGTP
jgi:signal transduction histidine kinase